MVNNWWIIYKIGSNVVCVSGMSLLLPERRTTRELGDEGLFVSGDESGRNVGGLGDRLVMVTVVDLLRTCTSWVPVGFREDGDGDVTMMGTIGV